jgi:hypothetical protein
VGGKLEAGIGALSLLALSGRRVSAMVVVAAAAAAATTFDEPSWSWLLMIDIFADVCGLREKYYVTAISYQIRRFSYIDESNNQRRVGSSCDLWITKNSRGLFVFLVRCLLAFSFSRKFNRERR